MIKRIFVFTLTIEQQGHIKKIFILKDIEVLKMKMREDRLEVYFTKLVGDGTIDQSTLHSTIKTKTF